jgi:uncharacterized membrane protein
MRTILRFTALLLTGLLAGAMFGIWLGFDPAPLPAAAHVEMQQLAIRSLNTPMPLLGGACIGLTGLLAVLERHDRRRLALLAAAALLLAAAGLVTRFGNQPINAVVMGWASASPPPEWSALRDAWRHWHALRTAAGVAAFALLIAAVLRGGVRSV